MMIACDRSLRDTEIYLGHIPGMGISTLDRTLENQRKYLMIYPEQKISEKSNLFYVPLSPNMLEALL